MDFSDQSKRAKRRRRSGDAQGTPNETKNDHFGQKNSVQYGKFLSFFDKHYKTLLILPLIVLVLSIVQIGYQVATTGDFVKRDISLTGGTTITVTLPIEGSLADLEEQLKAMVPGHDIVIRELSSRGERTGIIIESDMQTKEERDMLEQSVRSLYATPIESRDLSIETTGSTLGENFFRQTIIAVIVAFVFMSITVFITFRSFMPSALVILAAASDIVSSLAIFNLLGLELSTAGIAAFLMLIGYSVDTDILLTSRVLRNKEGSIFDRSVSAMKTGMLMVATTFFAIIVGLFVSTSSVVKEIMIIILIGLVLDVLNTWIQNASLLRWFLERGSR